MATDRCHIMIDTETLGQIPGCAVVSIGAVKFSFTTGIFDRFKINIDAADCKSKGLFIDQDTIQWWSTQPKEARLSWMKNPVMLQEALETFNEWIGDKKHVFWCHGASFDYPVLEFAYRAAGVEPNWKYWNQNDSRTIYNIAGLKNNVLRAKDGNTAHDALDDAEAQAKVLIELLKDVLSDQSFNRVEK